MDLTIAQNYLLMTEKITNRPMLRTRFTTQAYLVLAAFLDLRAARLITLDAQRVTISDEQQLRADLPASLQLFATDLGDALKQGADTKAVFKLLTSWNLANAVYDTVGSELERQGCVEKVIFQNNLLPKTIYEPTNVGRQTVVDQLTNQLQHQSLTASSRALLTIFTQLNALKWVLPAEVRDLVAPQLALHEDAAVLQALTTMAQERITTRKFELDSWLS